MSVILQNFGASQFFPHQENLMIAFCQNLVAEQKLVSKNNFDRNDYLG